MRFHIIFKDGEEYSEQTFIQILLVIECQFRATGVFEKSVLTTMHNAESKPSISAYAKTLPLLIRLEEFDEIHPHLSNPIA